MIIKHKPTEVLKCNGIVFQCHHVNSTSLLLLANQIHLNKLTFNINGQHKSCGDFPDDT